MTLIVMDINGAISKTANNTDNNYVDEVNGFYTNDDNLYVAGAI